jgi:hypothetical protein
LVCFFPLAIDMHLFVSIFASFCSFFEAPLGGMGLLRCWFTGNQRSICMVVVMPPFIHALRGAVSPQLRTAQLYRSNELAWQCVSTEDIEVWFSWAASNACSPLAPAIWASCLTLASVDTQHIPAYISPASRCLSFPRLNYISIGLRRVCFERVRGFCVVCGSIRSLTACRHSASTWRKPALRRPPRPSSFKRCWV